MKRPFKILLISHQFAPLNSIGALRVNQWTKYWDKMGCEIDVVTGEKKFIHGPLDAPMKFSDKVSIYEVPYLPSMFDQGHVNLQSESQEKRNFEQENDKNKNTHVQKYFLSFKSKASKNASKAFGTFWAITNFWIPKGYKQAKFLAQKHSYDFVVSSYSPVASHVIASRIAKEFNIPWLADYRDLWSLNHVFRSSAITQKVEQIVEKRVLKPASIVTTVSNTLSQQLSPLIQKQVEVIPNGYDPEEYPAVINQPIDEFVDGKINIVYAGTIYPGRSDPTQLFRLLKKQGLQEKVLFHFFGRALTNLPQIVEAEKAENFVRIHGYRARPYILSTMKKADVLLFLESNLPIARGVLNGKLFEYAALEKPILASGIDQFCESYDFITKSGLGHVLGESDNLQRVLDDLIHSASPDKAYIQTFDRSKQAEKVLQHMLEFSSKRIL